MELLLSTRRSALSATDDAVVLRIQLNKAPPSRVRIIKAAVEVYRGDATTSGPPDSSRSKDLSNRFSTDLDQREASGAAGPDDGSISRGIVLVAGDKLVYELVTAVPRAQMARFVVRLEGIHLVFGVAFGSPQWSASAVSLPTPAGQNRDSHDAQSTA
ncbi:hypothetical protein [Sorangium sp. So ce542]|uniref:hypothetical protein n=1 Tax=Sorangium sp. So ce542 TaxID=3133316 RepID=UPI003F603539